MAAANAVAGLQSVPQIYQEHFAQFSVNFSANFWLWNALEISADIDPIMYIPFTDQDRTV
jgi:hypothetical protein